MKRESSKHANSERKCQKNYNNNKVDRGTDNKSFIFSLISLRDCTVNARTRKKRQGGLINEWDVEVEPVKMLETCHKWDI